MRSLFRFVIIAALACGTAFAAPDGLLWSQINVVKDAPAGLWNIKTLVSEPIRSNPNIQKEPEQSMCVSPQKLTEIMQSEFRGTPFDTSQCPSQVIKNFGDSAEIHVVCPASQFLPEIRMPVTIKREPNSQNRIFEMREGDKFIKTTLTYLGKCP
jgi:hypothetical protein